MLMTRSKRIELSEDDIDPGKRYVIAGNHTGMPDPFVVCMNLPFRIQAKLIPFRFFVINRFFFAPLGFYLHLLGGFPAHKHDRYAYGLEVAYEAHQKGHSVVIFPEGKISKNSVQEFEPKSGVSVLARRDHVMIIPARLRWTRKRGILRSYDLAVGRPFDGSKMSPQQIMDVVYSLKFE